MKDRTTLRLRACKLAEEIRAGTWNQVEGIHTRPAPACPEIVAELERRCPGFDRAIYQQAIADGLSETR
jgi:hypothetical protein